MPSDPQVDGLSRYRFQADCLRQVPYLAIDLLVVPWVLNYPFLGEHISEAFRVGPDLVFLLGHPSTPGRVYFVRADSGVLRAERQPGCSFLVPISTGFIHNTPDVWVEAFATRQFTVKLIE